MKSLQTMLTAAMQIILFPKEAREAKELLNEMKGKQDEMSSSRNATSPTACREQETRKAPAIAPHPPHHAEETTRSVPIPIVAQPLCSVLPKCCQSSHVVTDRICWALTAFPTVILSTDRFSSQILPNPIAIHAHAPKPKLRGLEPLTGPSAPMPSRGLHNGALPMSGIFRLAARPRRLPSLLPTPKRLCVMSFEHIL